MTEIPENKYLGKLCKRGHDWNGTGKSLRYKSGACVKCTAETYRKWRKNNPEKVKENDRRWYRNNPEKVKERSKRWKRNNPEKVKESERKR